MTRVVTDVAVVGAGPGGLAAAVAAGRAGLSVCLIESLDRVGGNAAISTGYLAIVGSDEQREKGIVDRVEWFVDDLRREVDQYRDHSEVYFDEQLASDFAARTTDVYRLLRDLGFTFDRFVNRPRQFSVPRLLAVSEPAMFERLFRLECERLGVQLLLRTSAERLEMDAGRVVGVVVRRPDGRKKSISVERGVVMAAGGYQGNAELRARSRPDEDGGTPFLGLESCIGSGHRMMAAVGGDLVNMSFLPRIVMIGSALAEDVIAITPDGRRFCDETGPSEGRVLAVEKVDGPVHYLFDDAARRRYPDLVAQFPDPIRSANSLNDLGELIGCQPDALRATVREWNEIVSNKTNPDQFGRVIFPAAGSGIVAPPFHAARCRIGAAFTIGGARVDQRSRVLDVGGIPVPGLYAVGDCCGSLNAAAGTGGVHITSALAFGQAVGGRLLDVEVAS